MDNSLLLNLKTEQNLSPQMLQSLALLPMPILELRTYIQQEIESNPALEIPESEFDFSSSSEDFEEDDYSDNNYDPEASERKQNAIENSSVFSETLTDHLLKQLGEAAPSDTAYQIGELLIGNLDENGFYIVPLETLFENNDFTKEDIEETIKLVQTFDPYGICAQDFKASLIIQARCSKMKEEDLEIFTKLVYEHLENLKNNKESEVAIKLRIPKEDLESFIAILKSFTPYPGRSYSSEKESYVEPEFSVRNIDGNLVLEMNDKSLPVLEISKEFASLAKDASASTYVSDCIRQAKTLISQIELRKKTMAKVAAVLLDKQRDFFLYGPASFKTLTLKEVAEEVQVHETTISRLSQSKWVETDFGLIPLKYFFSQGVSSSDGQEAISRNAVKEIIAQIIKEHGSISDQKISDLLLERNIKCARRTVSKYRNELNIDSSFSR